MRVRPLAAAAAATTLATLIAGTAAVATSSYADTKTPTNLSIREARQMILVGQANVISGQLRARHNGALAHETVLLLAKTVNATDWTTAGSTTSNNRGVVHFRVSPQETTRYELSFPGDSTHFASQSGVVRTEVVQQLPTAIGVEVSPHSITPGGSADIRGRLHVAQRTRHPRPLPNQQVTLKLQNSSDNSWQSVSSAMTNDNGVVRFTVTPAATSTYALFFDGTDRLKSSESRAVTVWVGQPTALSIATSAPSVDPGSQVSVQGVLTQSGQPLAGQSVELRARPAHQKHDFTTVATGTTASDGTVSFTQSPIVDTVYRLLFRHTDTAATSVSPTATVFVRRATSLSIRNDNGTIRGALFGPQNPLANQTVTLESSPAGANTWTAVATQQTGSRGGVGFPVSPTSATDYRLTFAGAARFQACKSGVVTVGNG